MNLSSVFGPMPGRREAHAIAGMALIIGVTLCAVSVWLGFEGRSFMGRPLGGDFIEFYTIGKVLNNHTPARIYDLRLTTALQHEYLPTMSETQMLVFGQAPFIASLFRPFSLLPYAWAYLAWLVFSAGLYAAGLALLFRTLGLDPRDRKTGFLLAVSMTPFLFETWIGGQMSVVVFFIWALFFWFLKKDRRFLAGVVMALCLFKPTLVAMPVLMLIAGRRWRVLCGFVSGAAATVLLSLGTVGADGCRAWMEALALNENAAAKAGEAWHLAKYVDILAFCHLLISRWPVAADVMAILVFIGAVAWLASAWWRSDPRELNWPLWSATVCFTLVFNAYTPIYDSILLICAVALAASVRWVSPGWLLTLYLVPWITQSFAEFLHFQGMTVALGGFGIATLAKTAMPQLRQFRRERAEGTMTSTCTTAGNEAI